MGLNKDTGMATTKVAQNHYINAKSCAARLVLDSFRLGLFWTAKMCSIIIAYPVWA
jgi:hypothetical protein